MSSPQFAHPWPGRAWPASADEERRFVTELRRAAEDRRTVAVRLPVRRRKAFDRVDLTLVLTALRAGAPWALVATIAPGARPERMVSAYDHLDGALAASRASWNTLVAAGRAGDVETVQACADAAGLLLPGPVGRVVSVAASTPAILPECVDVEVSAIESTRKIAEQVSEAIFAARNPLEASLLARHLFDPVFPCLTQHPSFLPERVAELYPLRVVDLLGERRDDTAAI